MPKDVSSSEDEMESTSTNPAAPVTEKNTKYKCPADFVSFHHEPCSNTLTDCLKKQKNELWLIKAPSNFDPACFSGLRLALSGLQTVTLPVAEQQQVYSILASERAPSDFRLLTNSKRTPSDGVCAPSFSGLLNICESHLEPGATLAPRVIPSAPPPSIPAGLKQRYHPFGCTAPTQDRSITLHPLVETQPTEETREEEGRKKKKRKKEKPVEEVEVKQEEETQMEQEEQSEERRKKKKKKKGKEREEVNAEEVWVKSEPVEVCYEDAGGEKKKKKKKKSRGEDD